MGKHAVTGTIVDGHDIDVVSWLVGGQLTYSPCCACTGDLGGAYPSEAAAREAAEEHLRGAVPA